MSFEIAWPARWAPKTEATICEKMNQALKEAKVDPSLIKGQFEVKDVSLGAVAPHIMLVGVESASLEKVGVQLCLQYCDNTESGFNITIGGVKVGLTGAEGDGDTFTQSKLWYPFEATLYNIRIKSSVKIEGVHNKGIQRCLHKPPNPSALQELQLGRLRAARAPTTPRIAPQPVPAMASPPLTKSLLREVEEQPAGHASVPPVRGMQKGAGFGLAYASRRVHYPRWPRTKGTLTTPSHGPLTPGMSLVKGAGIRSIPSMLSLEGGASHASGVNVPSSPSTSVDAELRSPERRVSGSIIPPSQDAKRMEVRLSLRSPPEVDFSLRTNFCSLQGADHQIHAILKSLLKPKLELLMKGIVVRLPEGQIEFGPTPEPDSLY